MEDDTHISQKELLNAPKSSSESSTPKPEDRTIEPKEKDKTLLPHKTYIAEFDSGPIERLSLFTVLNRMENRLGGLESKLLEQDDSNTNLRTNLFLEFSKIFFGGWTAFGFIFLLLFYYPLSKALSLIPDKVESANEIQLPGISLKSTIERVATRKGLDSLAEAIPNLSSPAIELLLKAPDQGEGLVSYTSSEGTQQYSVINFPSKKTIEEITELQENELIEVVAGYEQLNLVDSGALEQLVAEQKTKLPGKEENGYRDDQVRWVLNTPLPRDSDVIPAISWKLTDSGKQAVNVILEAVSQELSETE